MHPASGTPVIMSLRDPARFVAYAPGREDLFHVIRMRPGRVSATAAVAPRKALHRAPSPLDRVHR
jgi:hypothetical protein